MSKATLIWLTLAACAVPVWAITQQYRAITIAAVAEDDCPYYYGAYALDAVEREGDHVNCVYR